MGVKRNTTGVLSVIEQWTEEEHTPDPSQEGNYPPRRSEGGLRGIVEN